MTEDVRLLLIGLGNLGRRFCDILVEKGPQLETDFGLRLLLVGAADSRGSAYDAGGLGHQTGRRHCRRLPRCGQFP
jgi:homoserine dehydrogenase